MDIKKFYTGKAIGFIILAVLVGAFFVIKNNSSKPVAVDTDTSDGFTQSSSEVKRYTDSAGTFSFTYNPKFSVVESEKKLANDWRLDADTPGTLLVTLSVPKSYIPGTNFSEAKVTYGRSADPVAISTCMEDSNPYGFLHTDTTLAGYPAKRYVMSDAGAGNRYDTVSYRAILDGDCYAIEYTIHSTNIGNYSPDQGIVEFDKNKIQAELEAIITGTVFQLASD